MALVRHRRDISSTPALFDRWKSPGDRPLPSPPSSPKGVSFPNPEVCKVLEEIWASRCLSLPERCDYADHVTAGEKDNFPPHESPLTTALREMALREMSSFSEEAEVVTSDTIDVSSPRISARVFPLWQLRFFIREVKGPFFHTYPPLGGPFRSLQDAENAFARHLDESRSPKMCTDGLSRFEIGIRNELYWPDGTRKKSSKYCPERRNILLLVQSLLDKHNYDHFSGDIVYELEDVVSYGEIYERERPHNVFYHINFTAKHKRAHGNLFFAEVIRYKGKNQEYVLNCFCVVKPNDKGRCYGCENNGSVDLKHPTDAQYISGHSRPYLGCPGFDLQREMLGDFCAYDNEEDMLAAEESRIRRIFKCRDNEVFLAKLDGATPDSSKREDEEYVVPAQLDSSRRSAPADSSEREYGQGKRMIKYSIPARRLKEHVVPVKLDGASQVSCAEKGLTEYALPSQLVSSRAAPADSSKRNDGQGIRKYSIPARRFVQVEQVIQREDDQLKDLMEHTVKLDGASRSCSC